MDTTLTFLLGYCSIAKSQGINLFCLPPHLTHILQPLDVGVYGPAKKTWKVIMKDNKLATCAQTVINQVNKSLSLDSSAVVWMINVKHLPYYLHLGHENRTCFTYVTTVQQAEIAQLYRFLYEHVALLHLRHN